MESGKLRTLCTIQHRTESTDEYGALVTTYAVLATRYGRLTDVSAQEKMLAGQMRMNVTHLLLIRHLDGLTADCRVLIGGDRYEISEIKRDRTQHRDMLLKLHRIEEA